MNIEDYPHTEMNAIATARFKVIKSYSMFWSHAVVAGDGEQHLYNGSESLQVLLKMVLSLLQLVK